MDNGFVTIDTGKLEYCTRNWLTGFGVAKSFTGK